MAVVVNDAYSVVTDAGVQAAIAAGGSGPQISITGFQIGSLSAADGAVPDPTATTVDNWQYTGTATQIYYAAEPNSDSCIFRVLLDDTVGNFTVGQIGLMVGTTLFSKSVLFQPQKKWQSNLPALIGNTLPFDLILGISNAQSCINLSILQTLDATLPEVSDETFLPDPTTTLYDTYLCQNNTTTGVPALAARRTGAWFLRSLRSVGGQGETVLAIPSSYFSPLVQPNMAVYFDFTQNLLLPADSASNYKFPIGIATSNYEVVQTGFVKRSTSGTDIWPNPLQTGKIYSVQVGSPGIPGLAPTYSTYGLATDANTMYVDMANSLGRSYLAQTSMTTTIGGQPSLSLDTINVSVAGALGIKVITTTDGNDEIINTIESTLGDGSRTVLI